MSSSIEKPVEPPSASSGVLPVYASLDIDAPIEDVWNVMTNFPDYGSWNPFIRKQTILVSPSSVPVPLTDQTPHAGQYMLLYVHTPPRLREPHFLFKPFQVSQTVVRLKLVDNEKHRLAWRTYGLPEWLLWCERWQTLTEHGKGCKYESYEVFGGLVAYMMWAICLKVLLLKGVTEMAEALKLKSQKNYIKGD
ncbi:hypothetical protein BDP27DRAFT_1412302 [Rhodocollybia butyracea]|uniref:Coenzyme Q-binding protein COQ10 START domain-containing protein n=1 Tax=Rhodocollybia butyracea TaxID=206335 RepID=A0A9P5UGE5_9AGAR|nr:hypothetical protein BDP27DRAFT_1412302 [Rhodocollybia butyracea]